MITFKKNGYDHIDFINCEEYELELCHIVHKERVTCTKTPVLEIITIGDDPASQVYVNKKIKTASSMGIQAEQTKFNEDVTEDTIENYIRFLNLSKSVDGVIVQLPIPEHISVEMIKRTLSPKKDVDGITYYNAGALSSNMGFHRPCTPAGIMGLLSFNKINLSGKNAVVVGRSDIVGKPLVTMLIAKSAKVTVLHSRVPIEKVKEECRNADIIISAVGIHGIIQEENISSGVIIIDVGINRVNGKLVGDVDIDSIKSECAVTPVPGGIGPLTVQMLMYNVIRASKLNNNKEEK